MKKYKLILILLLSIFHEVIAQDFQLVSRSIEKRKDKNLFSHYTLSYDRYAGSELFLYKNGKFTYWTYTDLSRQFSTGTWTQRDDIIELKSIIGKNALPVNVTYLIDRPADAEFKRFAVIKDLNDSGYVKAAIHINDDSVACFGGDIECFGTYSSIDSVRVTLTDEIYSQWIRVDPSKGIIQLTLQTKIDLYQYFPVHLRLRKVKNKLKRLES